MSECVVCLDLLILSFRRSFCFFFFFNDTATTEIYTLSLHDALPIWRLVRPLPAMAATRRSQASGLARAKGTRCFMARSEEHTSELQSRPHLVCRLLLEKKKRRTHYAQHTTNASATLTHTA